MNSDLFTLNIRNTQQYSHITRDIQKYLKRNNIKDKKIKLEEGAITLEDIVITKNKPTSNKTKTTTKTTNNVQSNLNFPKL